MRSKYDEYDYDYDEPLSLDSLSMSRAGSEPGGQQHGGAEGTEGATRTMSIGPSNILNDDKYMAVLSQSAANTAGAPAPPAPAPPRLAPPARRAPHCAAPHRPSILSRTPLLHPPPPALRGAPSTRCAATYGAGRCGSKP